MSIAVKVYNQKREEAGEMKLSGKVFGVKANEALIHQVFVAQTANARQVLAHTKDRSEVRGGGRKPWRQKGTGRARAGSSRSPLWIGGGVTFGPTKERNFKQKINKKMKQKAICMVISDRLARDCMTILDKMEVQEFKTKTVAEMIGGLLDRNVRAAGKKEDEGGTTAGKGEGKNGEKKTEAKKRSVLVVNDKKDEKVKYSTRNLAGVKIITLDNINIVDLLKHRDLILTEAGVKKLEERYGRSKSAKN